MKAAIVPINNLMVNCLENLNNFNIVPMHKNLQNKEKCLVK